MNVLIIQAADAISAHEIGWKFFSRNVRLRQNID